MHGGGPFCDSGHIRDRSRRDSLAGLAGKRLFPDNILTDGTAG
jgi:hypothetical protein